MVHAARLGLTFPDVFCRIKAVILYDSTMEVSVMENRVAVISIIVENNETVEKLNALLHEYGQFIIGRMGIPYRQRSINIISIAVDGPQDTISALSGKIGALPGVSAKTAFSSLA